MIDMVESFYEEKSFDKSVYSLSITKFDGEKVFHLPPERILKGSVEVIGLMIYIQ